MRPLLVCISACVLLSAAEQDDLRFTVVADEVSYQQRIEFVLGNGTHPFADEDQRRVRITLGVRASGNAAILGWHSLSGSATTDQGEVLPMSAQPADGISNGSHALAMDSYTVLSGLALPLTRQATGRLSRLEGSVELRFSSVAAVGERIPLSACRLNHARPLPGINEGSMTLVEHSSGRLSFHFDAKAFLVLDDLVFRNAAGSEIPLRYHRFDWRNNQGQLRVNLKTADVASVEVRTYRAIKTRRIDFVCRDIDLGLTLPGRDDLRGTVLRGAEEF